MNNQELLEKIKTQIIEQSHKEIDIKVVKGLHKAEQIINEEITGITNPKKEKNK